MIPSIQGISRRRIIITHYYHYYTFNVHTPLSSSVIASHFASRYYRQEDGWNSQSMPLIASASLIRSHTHLHQALPLQRHIKDPKVGDLPINQFIHQSISLPCSALLQKPLQSVMNDPGPQQYPDRICIDRHSLARFQRDLRSKLDYPAKRAFGGKCWAS